MKKNCWEFKKCGACESCEFYLSVREEEFPQFQFSSLLLNRIRT